MNAIPLINIAPPRNDNVNRASNKLNNIPVSQNISGAVGMLGNSGFNNETQLRQEVNTSIVALKREAFSLENLIAQAAQTLQDINKRLSELEGKQGDYVKKADATVESVGGNGKYISAISETDGKINATATDLGNMVPVNSVTSGNLHSVTSNAVYSALNNQFSMSQVLYAGGTGFTANTNESVLGAINYMLFDFNINVPSGYHKEYVLSAQITTTGGGIKIGAKLNNISTVLANTWSQDTYRRNVVSTQFKQSDIVLEAVKNYPAQQGTNLYIVCDNNTGTANIYNITITCFLVKD